MSFSAQVEIGKRFWSKVDRGAGVDGCWTWTACGASYGRFWLRGKLTLAHRVAYIMSVGPADGMCVLHRCDVKSCCNPRHLFLGTHADNSADMVAKGRSDPRRGSLNTRAKLTEQAVRAIRLEVSSGSTQLAAARRHRVSKSAVWSVVHGRRWGHVQ